MHDRKEQDFRRDFADELQKEHTTIGYVVIRGPCRLSNTDTVLATLYYKYYEAGDTDKALHTIYLDLF